MELKNFICVDAPDISIIDYIFIDQDLCGSEYTYPKPHCIAVGGENSVKIFEKNNIPKEYQKMFIICNKISLIINELINPNRKIKLSLSRFDKFKAYEYLTDININLAVSRYGTIFGEMAGKKPTFAVNNCYICDREDIIKFFVDLKKYRILDKYLNAIEEIMKISFKTYIDNKVDKAKTYKIKNS